MSSLGRRHPDSASCQLLECTPCSHLSTATSFHGPSGHLSASTAFPWQSSNIVYTASCTPCPKLYVKKTFWSLEERFKENFHDIRLSYNAAEAVRSNCARELARETRPISPPK